MKIKSHPFEKLDEFALLACQDNNLGNTPNWFGCFRGGLYGFYGRVFGIGEHFRLLHEWLPPRPRLPQDTEYHLSSTLFDMDSAVECLTFAFNALGFAALPEGFRDTTEPKSLMRISPKDIHEMSGYKNVYPNLQILFKDHADGAGFVRPESTEAVLTVAQPESGATVVLHSPSRSWRRRSCVRCRRRRRR